MMMSFTALLDTAIGLTLVYLGASLFVTILNETIAQTFGMRGRGLAKHLQGLLGDTGLLDAAKNSPMLAPVFAKAGNIGSYVDPKVMAQALVGELAAPTVTAASKVDLFAILATVPDHSKVKKSLLGLAATAKGDIDAFTQRLSEWLDRSLVMLGEEYKKRIRVISFILGALIAIVFNVDTVEITSRLFKDKELRESIVLTAEQFTDKTTTDIFQACHALSLQERKEAPECAPILELAQAIRGRNDTLGALPFGWSKAKLSCEAKDPDCNTGLLWLFRALGWLLTGAALSLGAPCWFDLLNRFVNIRGAIRRPHAWADDKAP